MKLGIQQKGFTIVELLIVIVVIGILAAITLVAFNGVQQRATTAAVQSELTQNAKSIMSAATTLPTGQYSTADVMPSGTANIKLSASRYKVVSYCANANSFVLAAQIANGDIYYTKTGGAVVQDNSIDVFQPCSSISVQSASTTYLNLPTPCASEGGQCTFSGTATIVYGSASQGLFNRIANATSPITCSNAALGNKDPAPTYAKACYVYPN